MYFASCCISGEKEDGKEREGHYAHPLDPEETTLLQKPHKEAPVKVHTACEQGHCRLLEQRGQGYGLTLNFFYCDSVWGYPEL